MKVVRIESGGMAGWQVKVYANLQATKPISISRGYPSREDAAAAAAEKEATLLAEASASIEAFKAWCIDKHSQLAAEQDKATTGADSERCRLKAFMMSMALEAVALYESR